jgi:hypothetical protein
MRRKEQGWRGYYLPVRHEQGKNEHGKGGYDRPLMLPEQTSRLAAVKKREGSVNYRRARDTVSL